MRPKRRNRQRTPAETLEPRILLTYPAVLDGSTLRVSVSGEPQTAFQASDDAILINGSEIASEGSVVAPEDVTRLVVTGGPARNLIDLRKLNNLNMPVLTEIVIEGGGGSDRLFGSHSGVNPQSRDTDIPNVIRGEGGNDIIHGGGAKDTLVGGNHDDLIYGWFGNDLLAGGDGDDSLHGGPQHDNLLGQNGDDDLHGETGSDRVHGGAGNDTGGSGSTAGAADTIWGGDGDDKLSGFGGPSLVYGGNGNDTLGGGSGDDTLFGEAGDDILQGGPGFDSLTGGLGTDILISGEINTDETEGL